MKFSYQGVELTTLKDEKGEIESVSEAEALRELKDRRIEVYTLVPHQEKNSRNKKVVQSDLVLPLQELATLTESGVVLVDALNALAQNKEHPGLANGFRKITSLIESGESFSSAVAQSTLPFPNYVQHLINAGELSGQLAVALRNASSQLNYDETLKNDLRSALTYPMVLIGAGISAMVIIFFAVVPKFSHLLDKENELPSLAWFVLTAGKYANEYPYHIFGIAIALVLSVISIFGNKTLRVKLLNLAIELPVVGPWLAEQDSARWASLCGAMLSAKVNLVTAFKLAAESSDFIGRKRRALNLIADVQSGASVSKAIERAAILPGTSINLIAVGDKTGKLPEMMNAVAKLHDESCRRRMKRVMTLVEPLAILIVGILIGIMILGIVMAITASTNVTL